MEQNQKNTNSHGFCRKFYYAVSFKKTTPRNSYQSCPAKTNPTQFKPNHILHQPNFSKTIPIESEPNTTHFYAKRDIMILNGDNAANHVPIANLKSSEDIGGDDYYEDKFSDYISKVKKRMINSVSNVGGGESTIIRRDGFNDKVTNYINHAKLKIRTSTNIGDQRSISYKY